MKRKVDEDAPALAVSQDSVLTVQESFENLGLDPRLAQGIARLKYVIPTPVQVRAIPLALEGRDVFAYATTGSGKTAAFLLPVLQSIIMRSKISVGTRGASALILVPTRELASQMTECVTTISKFCGSDVRVINLALQLHDRVQSALLTTFPDIVVATPSRASLYMGNSTLVVSELKHLVVDETDLVMSYGYDEDIQKIVCMIPQTAQMLLASATAPKDTDALMAIFRRDFIVVNMPEQNVHTNNITQYVVKCNEDEKFLLAFALLKLKLVKGKCIVFVADINRCYRLKLFLEQFGISSCVMNSELPVSCRSHAVEDFNKNAYDILITTDEHQFREDEAAFPDQCLKTLTNHSLHVSQEVPESTVGTSLPKSTLQPQRSHHHGPKACEYGVSHGIDFHHVACVLNFDLPTTCHAYIHRIGRTGRAGRSGMALSFVTQINELRRSKHTTLTSTEHDEAILAKIITSQTERNQEVKPYHFDMSSLQAFRYRVDGALKTVSKRAVAEARMRDLRMEVLRSERLKRHLEENPDDLKYLRHDMELKRVKVQSHMKHVPDYLLPPTDVAVVTRKSDGGMISNHLANRNNDAKTNLRPRKQTRLKGKQHTVRKTDPLNTFHAKRQVL